MGDMNFPDPNTTTEHDGWEWDSEKWTKWGSGGSGGDNTTSKTAIASGVMATGEMVVVNADGTVSVVEATVTPGGDMPSETGEKVEFYSERVTDLSSVYDPNSGKIVVAYKNPFSGYGVACAGEISGDSIVFDTPVVFHSKTSSYTGLCFDQSSGKVVIAFTDNTGGNIGKAVAGEVSGDTILFDSEVQFSPNNCLYISATYDPSVEKVIIAYRDGSGSGSGKVVVGSLAGGTLSFGTSSTFPTTGSPGYIYSVYDPISESTIISYNDAGSNVGSAVVGKVAAGNSRMTFGTTAVFDDTGESTYTSAAYDQASKKIVIAYISQASKKGRLVVGAVSGDTINFGAPVNFANIVANSYLSVSSDPVLGEVVIAYGAEANKQGTIIAGKVSGDSATFEAATLYDNTQTEFPSLCFDPLSEKFGLFYPDYSNRNSYGRVYSSGGKLPDILGTNLTSDNFIGVSKGNYADGDEATVQIAGINSDQQGMTIGKQYIQPDGTLEITEGDPPVLAGTAISSTELNIKDLA